MYAPSKRYIEACREFADSLGFRMSDVFERFCALVLWRQELSKMPLPVAEWLSFRDVKAMHDRRGQAPS
jgi:hypothetical protein